MFGLSTLLSANPLFFLLWVASIIISITIHEFSHAFIANKLGDPTPKLQGRLTLNPLAHLDLLGTIGILLVGFGWGKPVIFDPYNLKNPRRDSALIALAGPVSNLLLATILSLIVRISAGTGIDLGFIFIPIIAINIGLAIFNLIPIHPLDGGKILVGLAPKDFALEWDTLLNRNGTFILILLILPLINGTSAVSYLVSPVTSLILRILIG